MRAFTRIPTRKATLLDSALGRGRRCRYTTASDAAGPRRAPTREEPAAPPTTSAATAKSDGGPGGRGTTRPRPPAQAPELGPTPVHPTASWQNGQSRRTGYPALFEPVSLQERPRPEPSPPPQTPAEPHRPRQHQDVDPDRAGPRRPASLPRHMPPQPCVRSRTSTPTLAATPNRTAPSSSSQVNVEPNGPFAWPQVEAVPPAWRLGDLDSISQRTAMAGAAPARPLIPPSAAAPRALDGSETAMTRAQPMATTGTAHQRSQTLRSNPATIAVGITAQMYRRPPAPSLMQIS